MPPSPSDWWLDHPGALNAKPSAVASKPAATAETSAPDEDDFGCPCCLELYVEPVLLNPCGHSFCQPCLDDLQQQQAKEQAASASHPAWSRTGGARTAATNTATLECPLCRSTVASRTPNRALQTVLASLVSRPDFFAPDTLQEYHQRVAKQQESLHKKPAAVAASAARSWSNRAAASRRRKTGVSSLTGFDPPFSVKQAQDASWAQETTSARRSSSRRRTAAPAASTTPRAERRAKRQRRVQLAEQHDPQHPPPPPPPVVQLLDEAQEKLGAPPAAASGGVKPPPAAATTSVVGRSTEHAICID